MSGTDYEFIWSMLPFPAFVLGPGERFLDANLAAEQMVQTSVKQLQQKTINDVFGPDSVISDTASQVLASKGSLMQYNVGVSLPEKPSIICNVHVASMARDTDGLLLIVQPTGVAQKMSRTLTNLSAARSVEAMAAMLAHEIRNPLAGISGAAQLLAMNGGQEEQELTDMIQQESRRIGQLVERVEHFGDQRPTTRKRVNIHDVLDRACRAAKAGFASRIAFIFDYDPSLPSTVGDSDQLLQVFQNLIKNAAESIKNTAGTIRVRTSYNSGIKLSVAGNRTENLPLQIEIIDNGAGIPENLIADIFEPFVTSKTNGSGLGLPLVSKIVAAHGGLIECSSKDDKTVFCVRLPVWNERMGDA
ncbi:MAG: GHKL domain-containing protein [Rhodobacteraceae bacterium]|nr:GHKL domain-containing protein [Paracoccaceae bacterium]